MASSAVGSQLEAEVNAQQAAGLEHRRGVAAQNIAGQELLSEHDELRAIGTRLEAERAALGARTAEMDAAGVSLEQQVAALQAQVTELRTQRDAAVAGAEAAALRITQLESENAAGLQVLAEARASVVGGGDAGVHPGQAVDWRLPSQVFAIAKALKVGAANSSQDALEMPRRSWLDGTRRTSCAAALGAVSLARGGAQSSARALTCAAQTTTP